MISRDTKIYRHTGVLEALGYPRFEPRIRATPTYTATLPNADE